jgi:hypothetical protein
MGIAVVGLGYVGARMTIDLRGIARGAVVPGVARL